MFDGDGDRSQHSAERQRTGIAHEDRSRRRVEPEKARTRADHRPTQNRQLPGTGDVMNLQVFGKDGIAREIGDEAETRGGNHHGDNRQTVEPVCQVDGIPGADDDEGPDQHERSCKNGRCCGLNGRQHARD